MPLDKYISEFALNMFATNIVMCRLNELDYLKEQNIFNNENPCHIYMIGRRARLSIDKDLFSFDENRISLNFKAQIKDTFSEVKIEFENSAKSLNLSLESEYPYSVFKLIQDGKELMYTNANYFLNKWHSIHNIGDFSKNLDIEILYIGQAFGDSGSRTAIDRLKSHSTLQNIYDEAIRINPDKEIFLILFAFEQLLITSFDGRKKLTDEELILDDKHMNNVINSISNEGISKQQEINFTEAALIRYFRPPYNSTYKHTFPNPAHLTYSECYDLDINSVCVEINTEEMFWRIYSKDVEAKWIHFAFFSLHAREDRVNIFRIE